MADGKESMLTGAQRRCYGFAKELGIIRWVRHAKRLLPVALILSGPLWEVWSESLALWALFVVGVIAWCFSELAFAGERLAESDELVRAKERSFQHEREFAGVMWTVAGAMSARRRKQVTPAVYQARLEALQRHFLVSLVEILAQELGEGPKDLSANWMLFDSETRLLTMQLRDKPQEDRPKPRTLNVDQHEVGAAYAAKQKEVYIETDTWEDDKIQAYGERLPYRSFISVPILINDAVFGVVNVDSKNLAAFSEQIQWRIKGIAYHLAIVEIEMERT